MRLVFFSLCTNEGAFSKIIEKLLSVVGPKAVFVGSLSDFGQRDTDEGARGTSEYDFQKYV